MSVQEFKPGKWRATVKDPTDGKRVSAAKVLGNRVPFYPTKLDAQIAERNAIAHFAARSVDGTAPTVNAFAERWLTEERFTGKWSESTLIQYRREVQRFRDRFGDYRLDEITPALIEDDWMKGLPIRVTALRSMFRDAVKARQLPGGSPFALVNVESAVGNRFVPPPSEEMVAKIIAAGWQRCPGMGAMLQFNAWTGVRVGEGMAVRWRNVDLDAGAYGMVRIEDQWSNTAYKFTPTKTCCPRKGKDGKRTIALTPQARDALDRLPREDEFCFLNTRGKHWQQGALAYQWDETRKAAGYDGTLYLATRHFFAGYCVNVLNLDYRDIADQLGHENTKQLEQTYAHREREIGAARVAAAFAPIPRPDLRKAA